MHRFSVICRPSITRPSSRKSRFIASFTFNRSAMSTPKIWMDDLIHLIKYYISATLGRPMWIKIKWSIDSLECFLHRAGQRQQRPPPAAVPSPRPVLLRCLEACQERHTVSKALRKVHNLGASVMISHHGAMNLLINYFLIKFPKNVLIANLNTFHVQRLEKCSQNLG